MLNNKIDFAVIFSVKNANPNGDPLDGNRPRQTYDGYGEVSDVCIKRKIRNRWIDLGQKVFVQSDDKCVDGMKSLRDRANACEPLVRAEKAKDREEFAKAACSEWIDVRAFGQVFAFQKAKDGDLSMGIRGPVSIQSALSLSPVDISSMQITKSVNSVTGDKKSSDTMGMKHRIPFAAYLFCGSVNCQLAEKTGFDAEDAELLKQALCTLFENDCSSARPEGSMEVNKVYWWEHNCKNGQYSAAKVHHTLKISLKEGISLPTGIDDYVITLENLDGLVPEEPEVR